MKNKMKKTVSLFLAVLMAVSMSVTAFAAEGDFTDDSMTGTNEFYYTIEKENTYTDISGVKLSWEVPVVKYSDGTVTSWDTEKLMWVKNDKEETTDNTVTFTLTNWGSYAVKAKVSFALENSLKKDTGNAEDKDAASVTFGIEDPTDKSKTICENDPEIGSIVNSDHTLAVKQEAEQSEEDFKAAREKYVKDSCTATIKGTVKFESVSKLTADSGKLGTYTVTISKAGSQ